MGMTYFTCKACGAEDLNDNFEINRLGMFCHVCLSKGINSDNFMKTNKVIKVHLQGVGLHDALPADQLHAGMHIVYNFGYTSEVIAVSPTKSGKSVIVTTRADDGREYVRRYSVGSMVAYKTTA